MFAVWHASDEYLAASETEAILTSLKVLRSGKSRRHVQGSDYRKPILDENCDFWNLHRGIQSMPITLALEQWLKASGYEYHCFISWAHTKNKDMSQCARQVKEAIEESLALSIASPTVFLDESEIYGGAVWQETLIRSLCKSVAMVSICAPIYYHPSHSWCGLEWAAMDGLGQQRIPRAGFKTIIPVLLKEDDSMPEIISQTQYIDFSGVILRGRRYYSTYEFRSKIAQIVCRIEQIAQTLQSNSSITNCEQFTLPPDSAFANHNVKGDPFPFRVA